MAIFFEQFLIIFSSFFVKPVVPMITFFFNFFAKFKISIEDLGLEKSMIMSVFLNASRLLFWILIPLIFVYIVILLLVIGIAENLTIDFRLSFCVSFRLRCIIFRVMRNSFRCFCRFVISFIVVKDC